MTKISRVPLPQEDWEEFFDQICSGLTLLEKKQEIREFLNDLWTYTEKKMFSKRLQIARELLNGQTYDLITTRYKVQSNTIAAVSDVLNSMGRGFKRVDEKLSEIEAKKRERMGRAIEKAENPFKKGKSTVLGSAIKTGFYTLHKKLKRRARIKSVLS